MPGFTEMQATARMRIRRISSSGSVKSRDSRAEQSNIRLAER